MKEQIGETIVISSLPAKREELTPDTWRLDPLLAKMGFTDKLPELVRDLNYELGGNDLGDVEDTPIRLSYTFNPHRLAPRMVREKTYSYGPRIELTVSPQEERGGIVLKVGNIPQVSPSYVKMSSWLPRQGFDEWTRNSHITSVRLSDLQGLLHDLFPDRKATLYRRDYSETRIDEPIDSLTLEKLEELPTTIFSSATPYMVRVEGAYNSDQDFDPFLVLGLEKYPPLEETTFTIHGLIYDADIYKGSGLDVEKILEGIRLLWAKNPLIERYNKEYRQRAREIRERFLRQSE